MRYYLLELRNKKGYSMRKVAREASMSYQHYSRMENGQKGGKVSLVIMGRLAKVFGVSLDELYPLEEAYLDSFWKNKEQG